MSADGKYLLAYDAHDYIGPTPMQEDKDLIAYELSIDGIENFDEFVEMDNGFLIYFEMPKYTLSDEIIKKLQADQILEKIDYWKILY